MAIQDIIQEIKTLSSRQVLILVLLASLYLNFSFIRDSKIDSLNYSKEIKSLEKEQREAVEREKKRTDEVIRLYIEDTKNNTKKSYEYERKIDSLRLINQFRR